MSAVRSKQSPTVFSQASLHITPRPIATKTDETDEYWVTYRFHGDFSGLGCNSIAIDHEAGQNPGGSSGEMERTNNEKQKMI